MGRFMFVETGVGKGMTEEWSGGLRLSGKETFKRGADAAEGFSV